jgi:hypothetical protein
MTTYLLKYRALKLYWRSGGIAPRGKFSAEYYVTTVINVDSEVF